MKIYLNFWNQGRLLRNVRSCLTFWMLLLCSMLVPITNSVEAQTTVSNTVSYDKPGSSYTLSIPGGAQIKIEAWGGGGGGGCGGSTNSGQGDGGYGGGGGGGGYLYRTINSTITANLTLHVAEGGNGGVYVYGGTNNKDGSDGENSVAYFGPDTYTSYGGKGGANGIDTNGAGGAGGEFTPNLGGAAGSSGANGNNGCSGKGGDSSDSGGVIGAGGAAQCYGNVNGLNGDLPGGGGSGGRNVGSAPRGYNNGGNGASGRIRVTIDCPAPVITASSDLICKGGTVTLSVSNPVASGVTYNWYKDGDYSKPVASGVTYDVSDPGEYTVKAEYLITYEGGDPVFTPGLNSDNTITTEASNSIILDIRNINLNNIVDKVVCSGEDVIINPVATDFQDNKIPAGISYEWTLVSTHNVTGAITKASGTAISLGTLVNTTSSPGTVNYTVIPSAGDCTGEPFTLTVTVNPTPEVDLFSDYDTYCEGSNALLTVNVVPAAPTGTSYTYDWYVDDVLVPSVSGNTYTSSEPARGAAYIYHVVVHYGDCEIRSKDLPITFKALQVVRVTTDYTDIGLTGKLTATATVNPPGSYNFTWYRISIADGSTVACGYQNPLILDNSSLKLDAGNYKLYATVTPAAGYNGCEATSDTITFGIHSEPYVSIATDDPVICAGDTAVIYVNNTHVIDGNHTFEWEMNGVTIPNARVDTIKQKLTDPGIYEFKSRVVISGSESYTSEWSNALTITVLALPKVMLTGDNGVYCEGDSVTLTATPTPEGNYTYDWYLDDKPLPSDNSDTFISKGLAPRATAYTYKVIASSEEGGCEGISNPFAVTVKALPVVHVTTDYTDIGLTGKITATATVNPPGSYNFTWYRISIADKDTVACGYQNPLVLDNVSLKLKAGDYKLYATITPAAGYNGCGTTSDTVSITIHGKPFVAIAAENLSICAGDTARLRVTNYEIDPKIDGEHTFEWQVDGATIPNAHANTYSQKLTDPGVYAFSARVLVDNGVTYTSDWSDSVFITVLALPKVVLTGDNSVYCEGDSVTLTAAPTPKGNYVYDWYLDNKLVTSNNSNTFISKGLLHQATPYAYQVVARSEEGCEGISNTFAVTVKALPVVHVTTDYTDIGLTGKITATATVNPPGSYNFTWYRISITDKDTIACGYQNPLVLDNVSLKLKAGDYKLYATITPAADYNGCGTTSDTVSITIHDKPFVAIAAENLAICAGDTARLRVTNYEIDPKIDGEITYQWELNGVLIPEAILDSYSQKLGEAGSYEFRARVLVDDGVTYTSDWSNTVTVTARALPKVVLTGNNKDYCEGSSLLLTASVTPEGDYTYDWYLNNKLLTSSTSNMFVSDGLPHSATPYTYQVVVHSAKGGCEAISNEFTITVKPTPKVTITADFLDICLGGSVTATANVAPAGNFDFVWYLDNNAFGYQKQVIINKLSLGEHKIYVVATPSEDENGCGATSDTVIITVHDKPFITIAADNSTICAGDTAVLNTVKFAIDPEVTGDYTFQWALNGVIIPNAILGSCSQKLDEPGKYVFTTRVIVDNGETYKSDWSNADTITVLALPHVLLVGDNSSYCEGSSVLLTASATPVGIYTYDWYLDNKLVTSTDNNTFISSGLPHHVTPYTYQVIARLAKGGCEGISNEFAVTVKTAPTVTVTTDYTDICPDGSITAKANVLPADNYTYTWFLDNAIAGSDSELAIKNLSTGKHSIYVKVSPVDDYNGCDVNSNPVDINVHNNPVVTIVADNTLICGSGTVTLSVTEVALDSTVRDDSHFTYQWAVNGNIIDGATKDTYIRTLEAGEYEFTARVVQNDNLGCASNWSNSVTVVVMSIDVPSFFTDDCDEKTVGAYHIVQLPITVNAGHPQRYKVTFADAALQSFNYSGNVQSKSIEVHLPLQAGDYDMVIEIDGCQYETTGRVMLDANALGGAQLIEARWDDVLTVNNNPANNGGFTFYAYQWYKNNTLIPGADKQYYTEPNGRIDGEYSVELHGYAILANGKSTEVSFMSCPYKPSADFNINVYPVPVKQSQSLTVTTTLTTEELTNAVIEIYDVTGVLQRKVTNLSSQMSITGLNSGVYFGRLITSNNGIHNFRFIVTQ